MLHYKIWLPTASLQDSVVLEVTVKLHNNDRLPNLLIELEGLERVVSAEGNKDANGRVTLKVKHTSSPFPVNNGIRDIISDVIAKYGEILKKSSFVAIEPKRSSWPWGF